MKNELLMAMEREMCRQVCGRYPYDIEMIRAAVEVILHGVDGFPLTQWRKELYKIVK